MSSVLVSQVAAIWWAQLRTTRNHLPRRSWGALLGTAVTSLWYALAITAGVLVARYVPNLPFADLVAKVPLLLLAVFAFWQIGPLFTLAGGWSLQLNRLLVYPIPRSTLFGIEVFLRLTTAPEMIPILLGLLIGLLRNPDVKGIWPVLVLSFIPLNLFLSLSVREMLLHSFRHNRFRELFTVLLISIGLVPQLVLRTGLGLRLYPRMIAGSKSAATPWGEVAHLALGSFVWWEPLALLAWTVLFFLTARYWFGRALVSEETVRAVVPARREGEWLRPRSGWTAWVERIFPDPLAALVQKELQSLLRMPRFRVVFGMACVFSVIIFLPAAGRAAGHHGGDFMSKNFLVVVTLYGLLLLSDVLLLNAFGLDRSAASLYFATPISFRTVLYAKNLVAVFFMALQTLLVLAVVALCHMPITLLNLGNAIGAAAVVGVFFLSIGNLCSLLLPRPSNPAQTFRRQAGGKIQLWILGSSIAMLILVGSAYLAQWATGLTWTGFLVLGIEFGIGLTVYYVALDSAVERGLRDRERFLAALSREGSPIGLGT